MRDGDKEVPSNLMRIRERLAQSGKSLRDQKEFGTEDPQVQLEKLNELCLKTKGTPAYTWAQAKMILVMKEMEDLG